jgi:hypothetical protein
LRLGQLCALLGLTGFAISQPLLSATGDSPTLFVFTDVDGLSLVGFALVVAFVPPLVLWLVVVGVGLVDRRAGDVTFMALAVVLAGCAIVQLLRSLGLDAQVVAVALSVAAAVGFGFLLTRYENARRWLRYTAVLPVIAVVVFLTMSPTSALLRGRQAPTPVANSGLPPVVFLMLDEFPTQSILAADRTIDRTRFPNLAALADTSTWYRDYTAMSTWTDISVPSILSGQAPKAGQALWTTYPDTIFSLLAPTHEINAIESFTDLCGYEGCAGSGRASGSARTGELTSRVTRMWRDRVTGGSPSAGDLGDFAESVVDVDETTEEWRESLTARPENVAGFLEMLEPGDPPGFHYLHLLLPHQPWTYYPSGEEYTASSADWQLALVESSTWARLVEEQRHLWQARYADAIVGEIMDRLRQVGLYDDAVIVVTSDHGVVLEGTRDGGRSITPESVGDVAYAPLIVKGSGQARAVVDDTNLMSIDVLPTVAAAVGVEVPWALGHAAGSPAILERGDRKELFDFGDDPFRRDLVRVVEFDSTSRPDASRRAIASPLDPDAHPLSALAGSLGLDDLLRSPVTSLPSTARSPATGTLSGLKVLRTPLPRVPLPGVVSGQIRGDLARDGSVVLAVNGAVATVAPIDELGGFYTLLASDTLRREGNDVRLFHMYDDVATEVTLE